MYRCISSKLVNAEKIECGKIISINIKQGKMRFLLNSRTKKKKALNKMLEINSNIIIPVYVKVLNSAIKRQKYNRPNPVIVFIFNRHT